MKKFSAKEKEINDLKRLREFKKLVGKHYCKCGCNKEIELTTKHKYGKIPDFIQGHQFNINKDILIKKRVRTRKKNDTYKCPLSQRIKISMSLTGEEEFSGFKTPENRLRRNSEIIKTWRTLVFTRDKHTCQSCKRTGGRLNAHHIKEFVNNKNIQIDVKNGITLCEECHKKFHNIYGKKNIGEEQMNLFLNNT